MELKEGMYYTRSENGRLGLCKCEGMTPEQYVETYKKRYHVKKASYNIIDLIEVGDLVTIKSKYCDEDIYQVVEKNKQVVGLVCFQEGIMYVDNDDIKSIVTKEQFESMEYKVD